MPASASLINHFDSYVAAGWRVVPVHPRTKRPVGQWAGRYRPDHARRYLTRNPGCNLGLLLGDGIVDVEGDTPEANRVIERATAGTPHPSYRSSKSTHHLFQCPDSHLRLVKFEGIEFRGDRHLSVLPPSRHSSGAGYEWVVGPTVAIPQMPLPLLRLYAEHAPPPPSKPRPGCERPLCGRCGEGFEVDRERFALEVQAFRKHGQRWECHRCRRIDVRDICRFLKRRSRSLPC